MISKLKIHYAYYLPSETKRNCLMRAGIGLDLIFYLFVWSMHVYF